MRRHLAALPVDHSLAQLASEARSRFPSLIDFNTVDVDGTENAAVYLPDGNTTDPASWQASVAAHVPTHPTPEEQAAAEVANAETIRDQALTALANNRDYLAAPIRGTTNQRLSDLEAQAKAAARQRNGIIRLLLGVLDGTD